MNRAVVYFLFCAALGKAQTSLYIPGLEPQPVSADNAGVGSDGRTTWVIHKGEATDTSSYPDFIGTATLVQGPHDASLTYANSAAQFTIGQRCSFSQNLAICTAEISGSTAIFTEVASAVPIQTGSAKYTSSSSSSHNSLSLTTSSGTTSSSISELTSHPSNTGSTGTVPSPSAPANSSTPLKVPSLLAIATATVFFLFSYQVI